MSDLSENIIARAHTGVFCFCDLCNVPAHTVRGGAVIIEHPDSNDRIPSNVCDGCVVTVINVGEDVRQAYRLVALKAVIAAGGIAAVHARGPEDPLRRSMSRSLGYGHTVVKDGHYDSITYLSPTRTLLEHIAARTVTHPSPQRFGYLPPVDVGTGHFVDDGHAIDDVMSRRAITHSINDGTGEFATHGTMYICSTCHRRTTLANELQTCACGMVHYCDAECASKNRVVHAVQCDPWRRAIATATAK